jgi:hypothetical protein
VFGIKISETLQSAATSRINAPMLLLRPEDALPLLLALPLNELDEFEF